MKEMTLGEFFTDKMERIKREKLTCEECGAPLTGHISEIAHILPKGYFKSIKTHELNWLPLCGMYSSSNQCHSKFDDARTEVVKEMNIFKKVSETFAELEELITEKIPYKIYDRYTDE